MYEDRHILDAESNGLVVEVEGCSINVPSSLQQVPQHRAAHALVVVGGAATAHAQACHKFSEVSVLVYLGDTVTIQRTFENFLPVMGILEPPGRLAKSWFALAAAADMFAGTCAAATRHAQNPKAGPGAAQHARP